MNARLWIWIALAALGLAPAARGEEEKPVKLTRPKLGTHWYAMTDPEGKPQGYCRLGLAPSKLSWLHVTWTLKIAYPGGSYEEERTMAIDAAGGLLEASWSDAGKLMHALRRKGEGWVVTDHSGEKPAEKGVDLPADSACGMIFVAAAMLPLTAGTTWTRTDLNDNRGFVSEGPLVFTVVGPEKIEWGGAKIDVTKVEMKRKDGRTLPIWVNADREIVKADWGGGNLMVLSRERTTDLFKPQPSVVRQIESEPDELVVEADFPGFTPVSLYEHFTQPDLLTRWWPPKARVELAEDGAYELTWPENGWTLGGRVRAFERGKRFAFTWKWVHEGATDEDRTVTVVFGEVGGVARIRLTHGPYGESEGEQEARKGHLQGWEYFLTRLHGLKN